MVKMAANAFGQAMFPTKNITGKMSGGLNNMPHSAEGPVQAFFGLIGNAVRSITHVVDGAALLLKQAEARGLERTLGERKNTAAFATSAEDDYQGPAAKKASKNRVAFAATSSTFRVPNMAIGEQIGKQAKKSLKVRGLGEGITGLKFTQ